MDQIISANSEVLAVIKKVHVDDVEKIEKETFKKLIMEVLNSRMEKEDESQEI